MKKSRLFHARKGVPVVKAHEGTEPFGVQARAVSRKLNRDHTANNFLSKVEEIFPKFQAEYASEEQEGVIRNLASKYSNDRIIVKSELLKTVGLEPNEADRMKLRRLARNIEAGPSTDTLKSESEAVSSIEGLIAFWKSRSAEEAKSATVNEDFADLILLVMLKNFLADPALLPAYLEAMIFNCVSYGRGHVVAYLNEQLKPASRADITSPEFKAARKILVSRDMLALVNRLAKKSKGKISRIFQDARLERALRRRLRAANITHFEDTEQGLMAFGNKLQALQTIYLPPFLRKYHTEVISSCPQIPFWERFFSDKDIPLLPESETITEEGLAVIDSALAIQGNTTISNKGFLELIRSHINYVRNHGPTGKRKRRACLQVRLEESIRTSFSELELSHAQILVLLFAWRLAAIGVPASKKKGTLKTIADYIKLAADVVFEAYEGTDDWELSEEVWAETIETLFKAKKYNKRIAGRLSLFFKYLDEMEMLPPIPRDIIYRHVSDEFSMPLNQLISRQNFEAALDYADQIGDDVEKIRVIVALALGYYFGARFDEVWASKYCQIGFSKSSISFRVGGRGNDQGKSAAANRRVLSLYTLPPKVKWAFDTLRTFRDKHRPPSHEYVFHPKVREHRNIGRAKFSRLLNGLLKSATGNPRARFHDLRKTYVNALVLNIFIKDTNSHYLESICSVYLPEVIVPESVRRGGLRHKFWAQAVESQVGHSDFASVTALWYLCYASELYEYYVSKSGLDDRLRSCYGYLTRGSHKKSDDSYELYRSRGAFGIPEFPEIALSKVRTVWEVPASREIPITLENVANILQRGKPKDFSWMESVSEKNQAIRDVIMNTALAVADLLDLESKNQDFRLTDLLIDHEPFLAGSLPKNAIKSFQHATIPSSDALFGNEGIFERCYRNIEGEEAYVFETESDIEIFIDFLRALGFREHHIKVSSPIGTVMHAAAERSGVVHHEMSLSGLRKYGPRVARRSSVITLVNGRAIDVPVQYMSTLTKLVFVQNVTVTAQVSMGRA